MFCQRVYKDTLQFFFDPIGGDRIGAVWEPSVKQQRPFRVLGGFSGVPNSKVSTRTFHVVVTKQRSHDQDHHKGKDKKGLVTLNENAVLSEIERLASGLVQGIKIQV
jgi:U3 small nucleolar RNA-associated protein 22